jgi:hypothetical protein
VLRSFSEVVLTGCPAMGHMRRTHRYFRAASGPCGHGPSGKFRVNLKSIVSCWHTGGPVS